jgi:S-adenosyl methyltransferase
VSGGHRPARASTLSGMAEHRPRFDTTRPFSARVYNYWLGGKDHFTVDREYGDAVACTSPNIRTAAIENRRFLGRVVGVLAGAGVRQFLDIGTGLPTAGNTHEVAQAIAPGSRIVYVDNDPLVLVHARALLTSDPAGVTDYIEADLRKPERILGAPELRAAISFEQPVALMMVAVLHFLADDTAYPAVDTLVKQLAPGSYLVMPPGTSGTRCAWTWSTPPTGNTAWISGFAAAPRSRGSSATSR